MNVRWFVWLVRVEVHARRGRPHHRWHLSSIAPIAPIRSGANNPGPFCLSNGPDRRHRFRGARGHTSSTAESSRPQAVLRHRMYEYAWPRSRRPRQTRPDPTRRVAPGSSFRLSAERLRFSRDGVAVWWSRVACSVVAAPSSAANACWAALDLSRGIAPNASTIRPRGRYRAPAITGDAHSAAQRGRSLESMHP